MKFKIKLDFCIIPSPYSVGPKSLFFVTYRGENMVNENLCKEDEYELFRRVLNKYGFLEVDYCVFESSDNLIPDQDELSSELVSLGLKYSKPFEFNIYGELAELNREFMEKREAISAAVSFPDDNIFFSTTIPIEETKPTAKIPKVGEKITMYFYLFLQCNFINEGDCVLELIGDLYSKSNSSTRNYIQIVKSEFIRLESSTPNIIILQSVKTYADFIKEVNIMHKGRFKYSKPARGENGEMIIRAKEFVYNFIEIKKNINPVHRIVVEANINKYYDNMISMSKRIRKELGVEKKKTMKLDLIRPEMMQLKQKLNEKMIHLAEVDEFEKANIIKTDISFIDTKILEIDSSADRNITVEEFFKTFCLNS